MLIKYKKYDDIANIHARLLPLKDSFHNPHTLRIIIISKNGRYSESIISGNKMQANINPIRVPSLNHKLIPQIMVAIIYAIIKDFSENKMQSPKISNNFVVVII